MGYVIRPVISSVGGLPLTKAISRGAGLTGTDQFLSAAAQASSVRMAIFALLGMGLGLGAAWVLDRQRR